MRKHLIALFILIIFLALIGCGQKKPKTGLWRGVILTQGQQVPFNFELNRISEQTYEIDLINGAERFKIDSVTLENDSIYIPILIFDAYIKAKIKKGRMTGYWVKPYATDYRLTFKAEHGKDFRFMKSPNSTTDFSGKWEVVFSEGSRSSQAIGLFEQEGSFVAGSFLTNSGDYRYLEGIAKGDSLLLSLFDGTNAYLFKAKAIGQNQLSGEFYSGMAGLKTWTGKRNENASLTDLSQLTFMKEGYQTVNFGFPDMEGNPVSLSDDRFKDKVVIVQILGSWCINCMDETKFLAKWYKDNRDKPMEIVGLAFERKDDFLYAKQQLTRHVRRFDVRYPILFAGANTKEYHERALPMLEGIAAFPTTIFLDKNKRVRKIHTGFNGPGTGKYHEEFVDEFNGFMNMLMEEE